MSEEIEVKLDSWNNEIIRGMEWKLVKTMMYTGRKMENARSKDDGIGVKG